MRGEYAGIRTVQKFKNSLLPVAAGLQHWTFGTSLLFMTATTV